MFFLVFSLERFEIFVSMSQLTTSGRSSPAAKIPLNSYSAFPQSTIPHGGISLCVVGFKWRSMFLATIDSVITSEAFKKIDMQKLDLICCFILLGKWQRVATHHPVIMARNSSKSTVPLLSSSTSSTMPSTSCLMNKKHWFTISNCKLMQSTSGLIMNKVINSRLHDFQLKIENGYKTSRVQDPTPWESLSSHQWWCSRCSSLCS